MEDGKRILLGRFFAGVAIVLFVAIILWFFFFRTAQQDGFSQDRHKNTSQKTTQKDGAAQEKTPSAPTPAPRQGTTQVAPTTPNAAAPGQLADTGPGDAALILFFSAVILGGTGRHFYRLYRRKLNSL